MRKWYLPIGNSVGEYYRDRSFNSRSGMKVSWLAVELEESAPRMSAAPRASRLKALVVRPARSMLLETPGSPSGGRGFDSPLRIQQKAKKPTGGFFTFWWSRGESNPRPQVIYDQFYMRSRFIFVLAAT
jgi:hypothetical protein